MKRAKKSRGICPQESNVKEILIALVILACVTVIIGAITTYATETSTTTDGNYEYTVLDDGTIEITEYKGTETEVMIPATIDGKTVTSIGDEAFFLCTSLTKITIPRSVMNIGELVFFECTSLININVEENNKNYISENGVLFNKEKKQIICYPAGKQDSRYIIPEGVTSIGNFAFAYCSSLTEITIPSSVMNIGEGAFGVCDSLTEITISEGVTSIEYYAFAYCSCLTEIIIPESVQNIGEFAFEGSTNAKIYYKIHPEKTVEELEMNLITNAEEIKVYTKDKEEISEIEILGTGMQIEIKLGVETIEFTLVVTGDADGDGEVKVSDMTIVNKHRLNKKALEGEYLFAGDVTGDGKIDIKDLVKINKYRLHKIDEL